jgi:Zn-dependent M28 family amino/carboxypeptidase
MTVLKATGSDHDPELVERLRRHVDRLAGLIGQRHVGRPGALDAAAAVIEREFSTASYTVQRQSYRIQTVEVANLIAETPGTVPGAGTLILGAHYDTVEASPGADDNASGVAVLLETARLLAGRRFKRAVRFIAFTCEEPPHFYTGDLGSQRYARACRRRGEHIAGMLCLEMVGYFTDQAGTQQIPAGIPRLLHRAFPRRGNFLAAVGNLGSWRLAWSFRRCFKKTTRFPLYSIVLPESVHAIRLSDNSSFWDHGYPALMLTDTSFLRNPHYHLPTDTPDTLDYPRMAQVTLGIAGAVARLADPTAGIPPKRHVP